tara:strand:+ start:30671 stop:31102 length:432 start_codon:yes stop_codon:yes gene_type:complete
MSTLKLKQDIRKAIVTEVGVSNPGNDFVKNYNAQWDTGATNCIISKRLLNDLGLRQVGESKCGFLTEGTYKLITIPNYYVNLQIDDKTIFKNVEVNALDMPEDIDFIIGLDIISKGDFLITSRFGKPELSFVSRKPEFFTLKS